MSWATLLLLALLFLWEVVFLLVIQPICALTGEYFCGRLKIFPVYSLVMLFFYSVNFFHWGRICLESIDLYICFAMSVQISVLTHFSVFLLGISTCWCRSATPSLLVARLEIIYLFVLGLPTTWIWMRGHISRLEYPTCLVVLCYHPGDLLHVSSSMRVAICLSGFWLMLEYWSVWTCSCRFSIDLDPYWLQKSRCRILLFFLP